MRGCTGATLSSLLSISLLTALTSAQNPFYTTDLPSLLPRQTTCTDTANTTSCNISNFCCPSDTRCIPVAQNSSVVCCKIGEFCDQIFPVACTTPADTTQCGTKCCPLGYDCGVDKDRCILKPENLPEDHIANRNSTDAAKRAQCLALLDDDDRKCSKFPFEGVLTGLFPGIAIGVAVMFAYIKTIELKTRRRTIKFNGRLSASPDDLSFIDEGKSPPVSIGRGDIAIGYSPATERAMSPMTWKPRTPADYSPNLGPVIAPRERSVSRDRTLVGRAGTALSGSPLKQVGSSVRTSVTESELESEGSEVSVSTAITHTQLATNQGGEEGFSEVVIMDGTGERERGRGRDRGSVATGYTASVYPDRASVYLDRESQQVPPLGYGGSPREGYGGF